MLSVSQLVGMKKRFSTQDVLKLLDINAVPPMSVISVDNTSKIHTVKSTIDLGSRSEQVPPMPVDVDRGSAPVPPISVYLESASEPVPLMSVDLDTVSEPVHRRPLMQTLELNQSHRCSSSI